MKKINVLILLMVLMNAAFAQTDTTRIKPKITDVTVFLQGAQINCKLTQQLRKGAQYLVFEDITNRIDANSIQVKCKNEKATILYVTHRFNYMKVNTVQKEVKELNTQDTLLRSKASKLKIELSVYKQEMELIQNNKNLKGDKVALTVAKISNAAAFYEKRMLELTQIIFDYETKLKDIDQERNRIATQLTLLSSKKPAPTSEIEVGISAETDLNAEIILSYMIADAGWFPKYDFRIIASTDPMQLDYKADVWQNIGYDWKNVNLTLSTGNIAKSGSKPELTTWNIGYKTPIYNYQPVIVNNNNNSTMNGPGTITGKVITSDDHTSVPGASVLVKGTTYGTVTDIDGNFTLRVPEGFTTLVVSFVGMKTKEMPIYSNMGTILLDSEDNVLSEVVVTAIGTTKEEEEDEAMFGQKRSMNYKSKTKGTGGNNPGGGEEQNRLENITLTGLNTVTEKQTVSEFGLKEPYTILADNKKYSVDVEKYTAQAFFEYYCVPKIEQTAFLIANILEWEKLSLTDGVANLYNEGQFVGQSDINTKNISDTLRISMGRDYGIIVKREKIKEYVKRQMVGSKKVETVGYEISLRNNKAFPVTINLEDQIPVSSIKEIELEVVETSKANYNTTTGILKWKVDLKPGENKKLVIKYIVKYPKSYNFDF